MDPEPSRNVGVFDHRPTKHPSRRSALAESDICPNTHMPMSGRYGQITQTSGSSTTDLRMASTGGMGQSRQCRGLRPPTYEWPHLAAWANHANVGVFDHRPTNDHHLVGRHSQSPTFAQTSTCPFQDRTDKSLKCRGLRPPTYESPSSCRYCDACQAQWSAELNGLFDLSTPTAT
jgi:hypothetical protein